MKKLDPKAGDALIIAAITHDIERAFSKGRTPPIDEFGASWGNPVYDKWHSERSVKFVVGFLKKLGADDDLINETTKLISYHEYGGWKEADILKDADSLSFLEISIDQFLVWTGGRLSKKR